MSLLGFGVEETLERGLLSLEDSAHRIKELRQEREALLRRKVDLQKKSRLRAKVLPIRTELMGQYVWKLQSRLREKKIGYKREFLREILKEVRIRSTAVTLTYRLPITGGTPPAGEDRSPQQEEFFTLCELVEAGGTTLLI
jgi:hypothetical protein